MKKFLRNLFSGYLLVFLVLLLELAVFAYVQFFMDDTISKFVSLENISQDYVRLLIVLNYLCLRLVMFIISLVIFFKIINRQENPEFKIPWIVGMLLMPLFVSFMFMIFGRTTLSKKERRIIDDTFKSYGDSLKLDEGKEKEYKEKLENAVGTFNYINSTSHMTIHTNNKVTYYKCGEEFFPAFVESLKQAKEFIFMEFFIISDGIEWNKIKDALIEKAKEGVEVCLIYDDMGTTGSIPSNTPKMLQKYGIKCFKFHPFRPILSGVYNNRDHRKIAIIDHKMAFTGGMNIGDDYANEEIRFGYWKDTMVKIEGSAINNLIATFIQNFNLATGKIMDSQKYLNYEYEKFSDEGFVMPFGDGPGGIDNALIGEQNYINILNYAKKRVDISTPYLIPTYGLIDAMRNAALRGVEVNLIVPGIPDKKLVYNMAKTNFNYLMEAGVNIYIFKPGFNHMKSMIADDELAFVGTINFDFRSLVHHFECGTIIYKCGCMDEISKDFKEMIQVSEKVPTDFKMKKSQRRICNLLKIISALF